ALVGDDRRHFTGDLRGHLGALLGHDLARGRDPLLNVLDRHRRQHDGVGGILGFAAADPARTRGERERGESCCRARRTLAHAVHTYRRRAGAMKWTGPPVLPPAGPCRQRGGSGFLYSRPLLRRADWSDLRDVPLLST